MLGGGGSWSWVKGGAQAGDAGRRVMRGVGTMSGDAAAAVHGHRRSAGSPLGLTACCWLANAGGATLEHLGNCRRLGEKHPACLEKQLHF